MMQKQAEFERVAMPHLDDVYRMARRLTRREAEADDLVQETCLRAYRAFEGFELREYGAKPWLLKILHNVFYSRLQREARQPSLTDDADFGGLAAEIDQPAATMLADRECDWEQFDEELKAAVDELTVEYREVLLLWALQGLSYKEIAEVCGIAIGTVMSRLYRARQQLSQQLASYVERCGFQRGSDRP